MNIGESKSTFDVVAFGAVGDGKTDDSTAFLKAWKALCEARDTPTLEIPGAKTFLLRQSTTFQGPCRSNHVNIQITGNIVAPDSVSACGKIRRGCWLCFNDVAGLNMHGSGTIDCRGYRWWNTPHHFGPRTMNLHNCNNFDLRQFTIVNSPEVHIGIKKCNGGSISNIHINSPANSRNTDGIDIASSTWVHIHDSSILCGDDNIAINGGCSNINITRLACGPGGHGISLGSLGGAGHEDKVEEIHVRSCNLTRTTNGARIKTFRDGSGYAKRITFEDIKLNEVENPLMIDQHYGKLGNKTKGDGVRVSDVTFTSMYGTSKSDRAITLNCSDNIGCFNIVLNQINTTSSEPGKVTSAVCNNAHGYSTYAIPEVSCLSK